MASEVLHSPVVRGAVSGVLAAAVVDLHAFLGWKNVEEFASYSWGTPSFGNRWGGRQCT